MPKCDRCEREIEPDEVVETRHTNIHGTEEINICGDCFWYGRDLFRIIGTVVKLKDKVEMLEKYITELKEREDK